MRTLLMTPVLLSVSCNLALCADLLMDDPASVIARNVGLLVENGHYSRKRIDDSVAVAWMDTYLDDLDPQHSVFLQADVDGFRSHATLLDDDIHRKRPDVHLPADIFEHFRTAFAKRVEMAKEILAEPVDFAVVETYDWDRKEDAWPATDQAARELWRLRIKSELLDGEIAGKPREDVVKQLLKRYERGLTDTQAVDELDVLDLWLASLTTQYDPHSIWWKPSDEEDFQIDLSKELQGIGATLRFNDGYTTVTDLVVGGPADRSKLLAPNDRILSVAQGQSEFVDVVEMRLDRVVQLIRGEKGTDVRLILWPGDATDPAQRREILITRDTVKLEEQRAQGKIETLTWAGAERKIGVVVAPSFYVGSEGAGLTTDVRHRIAELEDQGAEALILDMRGNGGGSLSEAISLAGLFLTGGPVVQLRDPNGEVQASFDPSPGAAWTKPLVVMTDVFSASASEIVAGALQDYGRAVVVGGDTTHGKGTVQVVHNLTDLLNTAEPAGALKLTTQKFYRISGGSTQQKGVESDIVIPSPYDGRKGVHEADLPNHLAYDEIEPARYFPSDDVRAQLEKLRAKSAARVPKDAVLQAVAAWNARMVAEEADHSPLSLVLEERKRLVAEAKANEAPDQVARERAALDEALRIAADLLAG